MVRKLFDDFNAACLSLGIPAISLDTSARIMAVIYVHGENEGLVANHHFNSDRQYIQERFGLQGGETPDPDFVEALQHYVKELKAFEAAHSDEYRERAGSLYSQPKPQWAHDLFRSRYGIKLIN